MNATKKARSIGALHLGGKKFKPRIIPAGREEVFFAEGLDQAGG
jgi:hypothetical protein